ncbi:MAG: HNH endonuclease [Pirellulaceae bacterium]
MIKANPTSPLTASVLVLNRFYMPVHVVPVRRGIVMLYRELAEVIHVEDGQYFNYDFYAWLEISEFMATEVDLDQRREFIRSVSFQIEVPRVVRLYHYDKVPRQTLRFNRRNLFARDNHRCQFCETHYPASQLSFDHVLPRSRGGKTTWENVVCSCLKCNGRKGDRTPEEAGMQLVRKPVRPRHNPMLSIKLDNPKYECWRTFLNGSTMSVDVR